MADSWGHVLGCICSPITYVNGATTPEARQTRTQGLMRRHLTVFFLRVNDMLMNQLPKRTGLLTTSREEKALIWASQLDSRL